jgi:hypothetical protein
MAWGVDPGTNVYVSEFFLSPQIANPQILELISLSKIRKFLMCVSQNHKSANFYYKSANRNCAADFSLLNLPKGKSLGRSKPATYS